MSFSMTQVGRNWNQLITELNQWHQFGRDYEDACLSGKKQALELVR